ncbi:cytochrome P450 family protein [Skeletonema marinoi]|uniref:Cytochrome P450 family protein n=1 Tax=Skeletonema marinoi TaxID=267567 RepID=A0AAD8Y493_9STRA|nr:cytochrome P450 family protein [Skeletonema marinoi]
MLIMKGLSCCLLLLSALPSAAAFVGSPRSTHNVRTAAAARAPPKSYPTVDITAAAAASKSTTAIYMSSTSSSIAVVAKSAVTAVFAQLRRHAKLLLVLLTASLLFAKRSNPQTLLWPGTQTDKDCDAPLPAGGYGCPFIGINLFDGNKDYGPFVTSWQLGQKYGKIFKTYFAGFPIVNVSGKDNIKALLKNEFKGEGRGIGTKLIGGEHNLGDLFGDKAVLYENDAGKHGRLRKLAGDAMTPVAIAEALPSFQDLANQQVDRVLKADTIQMEEVFNDFTLDVAWKQILGLDLNEEDIPEFRKMVQIWVKCIMDPMLLVPFRIPGLMKWTKVGRARTYIVSKIEEKLDKLERDGPDSSTLSKLYFATDDEGNKLTREEVIHNAMILIFAGSETSSSTLTCASLLLGLHPNVWRKIKAEQDELVAELGEEFTRETLDKSVYLDSVIKETLRVKPIEFGEMRLVENTVEVDGKQIPKNWFALFNVKQTHWNDPSTFKEDGSHMDVREGFQPERWLDETTKPSEWMPFGEGGRRCIGERLGMAEMKVFLGMMARKLDRYDLVNVHGDDDIVWKPDTVMARPADGTEIRATAADTSHAVEYQI